MTPAQRQQFEDLLQEQERLALAVKGFDERLRTFMAEVEKPADPDPKSVVPALHSEAAPKERAPLAATSEDALGSPETIHLPPALPQSEPRPSKGVGAPPSRVPPPIPLAQGNVEPELGPPDERGYREPLANSPAGRSAAAPSKSPFFEVAPEAPRGGGTPSPRREPTPRPNPTPAGPRQEPPSLEMTLGTVWLARIGIVILVTGLVFLGNYAYQHVVHRLGPGGKIALLYLAAGVLAGLGVWLEKRLKSVGRYPQVLMAGGAATAYYTTYAAHFVARLKVIESPVVGGILLLIVGGLFVWWADRRKYQTAALLGILLSYYTAAINPLGDFTLYSNVLLTVAAGFLLLRNGWAMASWLGLAGTYASYSYWLILRAWSSATNIGDPTEAVRQGQYHAAGNLGMLATYWALFTATGFLASPVAMPSPARTTFLTLNNAVFFALASWFMAIRHPDQYWAFALGFGVLLLALSGLARLRRHDDLALDGAYLTQGLGAVTAGLAMKLTGPSLAITLAVESAVLLTAVSGRHGAIYRIGAVGVAVWAFCLAFVQMGERPELLLPLGGPVAALLLFDAWWLKQRSGWLPAMRWSWRAAGLAALGMLLIGQVLTTKVHAPWEPPSLALAALIATGSVYLLRLPEVVLLGQLYLAAAVAFWVNDYPGHQQAATWGAPWWQPLPVIFASLGLAHWWQKQRIMRTEASDTLHGLCAVAFVAIGYFWSRLWLADQSLATVLTCAGVATMVYGYFTRAWAISILGQVFAFTAVYEVYHRFGGQPFPWFIALLPVLGIVVAAAVFARGDEQRWPKDLRPTLQPAVVLYWLLTFALIVGWVFEYIPSGWQMLFFAGLGTLLFLSGVRWPARPRTWTGLAFSALALFVFWTHFDARSWPDLLALLLLPASQRLATRFAPASKLPAPWPEALVALTTASVWLWVTRRVHASAEYHEMLTVAWSGLAVLVFIAGLTLRERVYRIGGFAILALAIGRIYLVDVWRLETIYRILSFMVLGIVLLALGFVYNRYADQIRRWL